jgi:hypothetical protein
MTIRREIFKTNQQITIGQYESSYAAEPALANSRAGELVVDLSDPATPELYIANNTGVLTLVGGFTPATPTSIVNGTSNVVAAANANVTIGVAGNAAIVTVSGTGANIAGTGNVTGSLTVGANLTVTNKILGGDGNVSAPTYGFSSEGATDSGFYWVSDGNVGVTNNGAQSFIFQATTFKQTVVAFSALPAATTAGLRGFINDGNLAAATNFGAQVAGSGSNTVPVFSDGTNWRIG